MSTDSIGHLPDEDEFNSGNYKCIPEAGSCSGWNL